MQQTVKRKLIKVYALTLLGLICSGQMIQAQIHYQPYSYGHYHRYMQKIYSDTLMHTAVKPYVQENLDALYDIGPRDSSRTWWERKLFDEHLLEVNKEDHTFYLDIMPDLIVGKEAGTVSKTVWTNSRGVQAGLSVKDKFSLYVSFYENQARYPSYIDSTARAIGNLPGQGFSKNLNTGKYDWMNSTANISYHFSDAFQVSMAYDKIHIGEGYRSVLISDNAYNFTHARLSGTMGRWQYNSIWAYMNDLRHPMVVDDGNALSTRLGNGVKYGAFHYVDYIAGEQLSIGLFHSLIWAKANSDNKKKVNGGLGLNVRYQPWQKAIFYGQLYVDDIANFGFGSGGDHRTALQLGGKTYDILDVPRLNLTVEYNQAAPYTYQHVNNKINYTSNGEALAHPLGANFREVLGIVTYGIKRWDFYAQGTYARYGVDRLAEDNVGKDLFKEIPTEGNYSIGQGYSNNFLYGELRTSYVMNPKYNLRWELGVVGRMNDSKAPAMDKNSVIVTFGLRSSFRAFQQEY